MKVALVTGGAHGIGAAIAERLWKDGYTVAVNYNKSKEDAEKLCDKIGGFAVCADLKNESEVADMFRTVKEKLGAPSVLVNNAGVSFSGLLQDMRLSDYEYIMNNNFKSVFLCCKNAIPDMIREKDGKIINISSMWGICGASCEAVYSASKAAIDGLTKSLAKELAPSGITVNSIAPGACDTNMMASYTEEEKKELRFQIPIGRFCETQEIADAVSFICSCKSITGQVINLSGGLVI